MTELPSFATFGLNVLHQWAAARALTYGFERSARFVTERLDTERALFSFSIQQLGAAALADTLMICREMQAPDHQLRAIQRYFPAAAYVHFGFEAADQTLAGKCYLELPCVGMNIECNEYNSANVGTGRMQFLGFKWSMTDRSLMTVTRYRLFAEVAWDLVRERMLTAADVTLRPLLRQLLAEIEENRRDSAGNDGQTTWQPTMYRLLEIEEEGSERKSCDINIYDDGLTLHQLAIPLRKIADVLLIHPGTFQTWLERNQSSTVGHLATGIHRNRQSFLTVYWGARQIDAAHRPENS